MDLDSNLVLKITETICEMIGNLNTNWILIIDIFKYDNDIVVVLK